MVRPLELLAPARDLATGIAAIDHGADAVYIGAPTHGARAAAVNTVDDIARLVQYAAPFGVKIYVTVNTIIYDDELDDVAAMIRDLYRIGVDALIVQDMGVLRMDIPPIALHASTQCDTRDPAKARFLQEAGFSQIVVARELGIDELRSVCRAVDVPVEAFVHGALCVSYSGDCQASYICNGRSANRGNCAQICRLPFDLIDGSGKTVLRHKHLLSLRDMNRIDHLAEMADAGVSSFKIEGRLKDVAYVKNVVAAYRRALDSVIDANPDRYCRASLGVVDLDFTPALENAFNRGYTDYFLHGTADRPMATFDSPKAVGQPIGKVLSVKGKTIDARLISPLSNGDGLTYIAPDGRTGGFRANRVDGNRITLLEPVSVPAGATLYRSFDRLWEDRMARPTATRRIPVALTLRRAADRLVLDGRIDSLGTVSVALDCQFQPSEKPDNGYRARILAKLGNTIFTAASVTDLLDSQFVAASLLTDLRRRLVAALTDALLATRTTDRRHAPGTPTAPSRLTRHDNVANRLSRAFYQSLPNTMAAPLPATPDESSPTSKTIGIDRTLPTPEPIEIEPATELQPDLRTRETIVMTTRYCLRRELGACLRTPGATRLNGPLYLRSDNVRPTFRLDFDCAACRMRLVALPLR